MLHDDTDEMLIELDRFASEKNPTWVALDRLAREGQLRIANLVQTEIVKKAAKHPTSK